MSMMPIRQDPKPMFHTTMPERGEAKMVIIYRSDDDQIVVFTGAIDRWACTAIQTGQNYVEPQILKQLQGIVRDLCNSIYRRFGLGAMEAPKLDAPKGG